jgi:putative transposase
MERISAYGFQLSFSAVGKPRDNPWSESFFSILKKEIIHQQPCATREEARQRIFEYIETLYNTARTQKRMGYLNLRTFLSQCLYENAVSVH